MALNRRELALRKALDKAGDKADREKLLILKEEAGTEGLQLEIALRRLKRALSKASSEWAQAFSKALRLLWTGKL